MTGWTRSGALAAAAALSLAGVAQAAPPAEDAGPPIDLPLDQVVTQAVLTQTPANNDLQREYPQIALRMNLDGWAAMTCKALITGRLDDCHVVGENPEGIGFGAATVRTAVYFRVTPATRDGRPVEGNITIPMRWMVPGHDPTQPLVLAPATPTALQLGRRVVALEDVKGRMEAGWRAFLAQQTAQAVGAGDARMLVDAYKHGLDDTAEAEAERQAHELASRESEADLKATVAFLESPAGRAWTSAETEAAADAPHDYPQRIGDAARTHYCPNGICPDAGEKTAAAR